jgi:hypothetical protein
MEIHPGDAAWPLAEPLVAAAWPPEVRATASWSNVVWAPAQQHLLVWNDGGELVCHVGLNSRHARWNDRDVQIGCHRLLTTGSRLDFLP